MKVAFDIHKTLDTKSPAIIKLFNLFSKQDHSIFIISGPPIEQIEREFFNLELDLPLNFIIISVVDYLKNKGVIFKQDEKGHWWCDEDIWWASKGWICKQNGIDVIFDDKLQYKKNMPKSTEFIHWK